MGNEIRGERALVTGSGTGIGKALAIRLAKLGCDVILVGRTASKLEGTKVECEKFGVHVDAFPADLTSEDSIKELIAFAGKDGGRLDIVVNNAGVLTNKSLEETTTKDLDAILATNIRAPYLIMRESLPLLRRSPAPEIINMGSAAAHDAYVGQSAYSASKHAILGMSKCFAQEVYQEGIRVHVLSPGGVLTDMIATARPDLAGTPMIVPDDLADAMEFLLTHRTDGVVDEIRIHRSTKAPGF